MNEELGYERNKSERLPLFTQYPDGIRSTVDTLTDLFDSDNHDNSAAECLPRETQRIVRYVSRGIIICQRMALLSSKAASYLLWVKESLIQRAM